MPTTYLSRLAHATDRAARLVHEATETEASYWTIVARHNRYVRLMDAWLKANGF